MAVPPMQKIPIPSLLSFREHLGDPRVKFYKWIRKFNMYLYMVESNMDVRPQLTDLQKNIYLCSHPGMEDFESSTPITSWN